jgi:WD40 repeat protein
VGSPSIVSVAVRPDGRKIATALGLSTPVLIWGPDRDGGPHQILRGPVGPVSALAWSRDGRWLAAGTASVEANVYTWGGDGAEGTLTPGPVLKGHTQSVSCVALNGDGSRIASGSNDHTVRLWHRDGRPGPVLKGHTQPVVSVAWSADGRHVASASHDGTIRLWLWASDGTSGKLLAGYDTPASSVAFSPDGRRIAGGNNNGLVQLFRAADGSPGLTLGGHRGNVPAIAWMPDSTRLVVGSFDAWVFLRDVNGTMGPTLTIHPEFAAPSVACTSDGRSIVAASRFGFTRCWSTRTLATEWLAVHTAPADVTVFSPSGRVLASTPAGAKDFVYLVERPDHGIDLLTREAFEKAAGGP